MRGPVSRARKEKMTATTETKFDETIMTTDNLAEQLRRDLLPMCFVVPGDLCQIIDTVNPQTGRSTIRGETLAQVREREPGAVIMPLADWIEAKTKAQDQPGVWVPVSEEKYWRMLEVLPPAAQFAYAFLVGEATDHHAASGQPRFACYRERDGAFEEYSRPMTHREFEAEFGKCPLSYS